MSANVQYRPERIQGLIAGGYEAIFRAKEGAEDSPELGRQITERYKDSGSDMVLVGLLRGSFMFMADLCVKFRYLMKSTL